jgi:hypothetical protein
MRASRLTGILALALVLLPFLVYSAYLSGDRILYTYDYAQLQYPRFEILCDTLQSEGGLPLWQTALHAGSPFHANPETPTLYPPVLALARFLPAVWVMNLTILLHTALGALGMYLLVLRLWRRVCPGERGTSRGGEAGALVAALVFGFNAYTRLEHFNLLTYGSAHALIPWIVLAADHVLHGRAARRAAAALALLLGAQVLTGGLYVYAYTALALALWFLFEGLLGGAACRRRALGWGLSAGVIAALLAAAKLAPYAAWLETTNRVGRLSRDVAAGMTLGGHADFSWSEVAVFIRDNFASGLPLLLVLPALMLLRHRVVRVALGIALLGALVGLGGMAHGVLYEYLPPFDRIRNAARAWTLANAFLPIVVGFGLNQLLVVLGRRRRLPETLIGIALGVALMPALLGSGRHEERLRNPASFDEVLTRYDNWPDIAEAVGDTYRATSLDVRSPASRNEQFISTALGVEIVGGQLGRSWSPAMVRHLYSGPQGKLSARVREGRLGILSVRMGTEGGASTVRGAGWSPELAQSFPAGAVAERLETMREARPRALLPGSTAAVFGDGRAQVQAALLDGLGAGAARHSVLSIGTDEVLGEQELFDLAEIVVVEGGDAPELATEAWLPLLAEHGVRLTHVSQPLDDDGRATLAAVAERMAARDVSTGSAKVTRATRDEHALMRESDDEGRWVTLSESWLLSGGWTAFATRPDFSRRKLPLRLADRVAVAFHLREGETAVIASRGPLVGGSGMVLGGADDTFPAGIDGERIAILRKARPRALLPGSVTAVIGDRDNELLYVLLDLPGFVTARHSVLSIAPGQMYAESELLDLDEVVLVDGGTETPQALALWSQRLDALGLAVTRVSSPLSPTGRLALADVSQRMATRGARSGSAQFTRVASGEVTVSRDASDEGRWVTLSETWLLYGGWNAWALDQSGGRRELPLRSADGVVVACHLRPGESSILARYEPVDVARGLGLGALGLALALLLLAPWPARARSGKETTA